MKSPTSGQAKLKNIIAGRLRKARTACNPPLTQDQLSGRLAAKRVTLDRVAITKIENAQRCVFDFEVKALAEVLKVDPGWLLGMHAVGGPRRNQV
ncbi:MAG TPA: helix-turn-helix transcriptional regulator [Verrucomicrobiales bacterium]|jgi:hypothetical protein|nr:helix-turn-helix transcriptional regulator [Verrucomicrobiales bacterium]